MHILYVHQYFKTPEEGGAIRSYYIARAMVQNGHTVTMITTHNQTKYTKSFIDGIHVHYLPVSYTQEWGFLRRIMAFLTFVFLACKLVRKMNDADLCYATSTPLTVGLVALFVKWKFGIPYFFEVRDLWPEAPVQLNIIKSKLLKKILYRFEKIVYQRADKLIALSPTIKDYIARIVPRQNILLIPNMSDCQFFNKSEKNPYHEYQFDVEGKFVITYFGAVGKVNHLEYFLNTAYACENKLKNVVFLLAGQGSEMNHIRQKAHDMELSNIRFVPYQNKYGLLSLLNVTDAAYISFASNPCLQANCPNKFFDTLAAGKLCITTTRGWLSELVEIYECGFYSNPEQPETIVPKIARFVNDAELLNAYKKKARNLAESEFDKDIQIKQLLDVLQPETEPEVKAYTLHV